MINQILIIQLLILFRYILKMIYISINGTTVMFGMLRISSSTTTNTTTTTTNEKFFYLPYLLYLPSKSAVKLRRQYYRSLQPDRSVSSYPNDMYTVLCIKYLYFADIDVLSSQKITLRDYMDIHYSCCCYCTVKYETNLVLQVRVRPSSQQEAHYLKVSLQFIL